jgi:hypothetical protein
MSAHDVTPLHLPAHALTEHGNRYSAAAPPSVDANTRLVMPTTIISGISAAVQKSAWPHAWNWAVQHGDR